MTPEHRREIVEEEALRAGFQFRRRQSVLERWLSEHPRIGLVFLLLALGIAIYYWATGTKLNFDELRSIRP